LAASKETGRRSKPLIADYLLIHRNTKLAVVEAKAWDELPTEASGRPRTTRGRWKSASAYATNGQGIYGIDMQTGKEGEAQRYPTPDELWNLTFAEAERMARPLRISAFEDRGGFFQGSYYQDIAIERSGCPSPPRSNASCLTGDRDGQTFIAFQIAWKLFPQPLEFGARAVTPPRILSWPTAQHPRRSGLQRLLRLSEDALVRSRRRTSARRPRAEERQPVLHDLSDLHERARPKEGQPSPYFGEYPPDFFDFIVIERFHRGGANDEKQLARHLEYFAPACSRSPPRPSAKTNIDTYAYFGEPVYVYSSRRHQ